VPFEQGEIAGVRPPEDVGDRPGERNRPDAGVEQGMKDHPREHDARNAPLQALNEQGNGKRRARQIADSGDQRQQRIEAEPDRGAGNPKSGVEQVGPAPQPREVHRRPAAG
jgi:hypothetical protein